jgi:hypothetical protein
MELEESSSPFTPEVDRRRRMDEPLPVKLIAVADVTLPCNAGLETALDRFYGSMLQFERDLNQEGIVYRADNYRLRFQIFEGLIERESYRPLVIEVQSLADTEQKLIDREIEYEKQKGVFVGQISLTLLDPAGNYVELVESKKVM